MANSSHHHSGHGVESFVVGLFLGSYLRRHRHQPKPEGPNSPLNRLDARQAMTAVSIARILGYIMMGLFLGCYIQTMWHL